MLEVVAFVLRRFGCVLPCLAGACSMHLDVLFATQLVGISSRLQRSRALTWSTCRGSPAHAFDSWLASYGWDRTAEWTWTHSDSGCRLDLSSAGDIGQRQHAVRDAWLAWCLRRHMASERRDAQLDCFHDVFVGLTGMLSVSLLLPVRKPGPWLVVPLSLLLLLVVGCLIVLPPCAFGMVALNLARLIMSSSPF